MVLCIKNKDGVVTDVPCDKRMFCHIIEDNNLLIGRHVSYDDKRFRLAIVEE